MISSQVSEKQELTLESQLMKVGLKPGFANFTDGLPPGLNLPMARGAVGLLDVRDVWLKPKSRNCSAKA